MPELFAELKAIDIKKAERTGRERWGAESGSHDDLVASAALAVWWAERPSQGASFIQMWTELAVEDRLARGIG